MDLVGAAPAPSAAQQETAAATSAYTELDLDRCEQTKAFEEESAEWRCPGHAGIPLIVLYGDIRFDLDAGEDNGIWESQSTPNHPPSRVEWRLRDGRPHAIIYRLRLDGEGVEGRSFLAVETIGRPGEQAGCLIAWIDGAVPDANEMARERADRDHQRFRCGHDEPEEITTRSR
jgi:hypothetical protein